MSNTRPSFSTIFKEPAFWILSAITIAFFYRPLFNNETFFFRDLYMHFYPQKKMFAELVLSGQLPLWDPYRHGGQPFLANTNNTALYPSNVLYLFLSPVTAINVDIVLHVLLAAWSAYLLARVLSFNMIASLTCGIIFGFSGPTLSVPNVNLYVPFHLPLMLTFWHLHCIEGKKRWFVAAIFAGAVQVFAGRPEMVAITGLTLFLWTLFFPYQNKLKQVFRFLILELFVIGVSAIQLIPAFDLIQQSPRGQGIDVHSFFAWSVDPRRYPELFIPNFIGSVYSLNALDLWGRNLEDLGMPYTLSIYLGVPVLILAILGSINKEADEQFPRKIRTLLVLLTVISFVSMAGRHIPGAKLLFNVVPGIAIFRYPVKFIYLGLLPLTLLAGWQLHYWIKNPEEKMRRFSIALIMVTATVLTILTIYSFVFTAQAESLFTDYFSNSASSGLRNSILHAAAASVLLMLLVIYRTLQTKINAIAGVSILIGMDLLVAGSAVNQYAPREFLTEIPDLAKFIRKEIGNDRFFRDWDYGSMRYRVPSKERFYVDRWHLELLNNYNATQYYIPVVFHEDYDWLALNRMVDLTRSISKTQWPQRLPILSAAAVRFVLSSEKIQLPDLRLVRVINNASNKQYFLYINQRRVPRTAFITNYSVFSKPSEVLRTMTQPSFDPRNSVLLEEAPITTGVGPAKASLKLLEWQSTSSTYEVITDKPGFIVYSEPFTSGWRYKVDDWNVRALHANYAFSAVVIPAGKHYVKRTYWPVSVTLGFAVSLVSIALLGAFTFANMKKKAAQQDAIPVFQ